MRERNQSVKLGLIVLDLILAGLSFSLATILHFYVIDPEKRAFVNPDDQGLFAPAGLFPDQYPVLAAYFFPGLLFALSQVMVFVVTDIYQPARSRHPVRETVLIGRGVLLNLILILAFLFFYRGASLSRLVIAYTAILAVILHGSGHFLFRLYLMRLREKGVSVRKILIVGNGSLAYRFYEKVMRNQIYGYRVIGVVGAKKDAHPTLANHLLGPIKDFEKLARQINPDIIVYALSEDHKRLQKVVEFCDSEGFDCRIVPDMVDLITSHARIEDMDGMPVLTLRDIPLKNGYNRFLKRGFDIVFSGLVIVLTFPVWLVLALLVKFSSPGPVLFAQDRVGLDRNLFKCYKFRTMVVQDQSVSDTTWGGPTDQRVTRIGRLLRKTSLDELPQFINVFLGDMSVVGPRPERPHFVQQFKTRYSHYMRRHSVKSGITGWAQIQGLRGDTSIEKRVQADIYYIENWSFLLDIVIVLRTVPSLISNPGQ
ncbi:MAG: undecaprenyl-phosphate glucose phosphotransferase [Spirochaetaceae bacterium]|nr:undecaprenyl-phosphate glucose phosphotransferase [Spirochaetaceae bacterium]